MHKTIITVNATGASHIKTLCVSKGYYFEALPKNENGGVPIKVVFPSFTSLCRFMQSIASIYRITPERVTYIS